MVALLLAALWSAPAWGGDQQVYVWRDRDGTVRFSAVEPAAVHRDADAGADTKRRSAPLPGGDPFGGRSGSAAPPL